MAAPIPARRPRRRRWPKRLALAVALVVVVAYAAVGWYVSGEIIDGLKVKPSTVEYDVDVVEFSVGSITLQGPDEDETVENRDAVMGLRWEGGYGQVGPASGDSATEVRPFTLLDGAPPPVGAAVAAFDGFAFTGDPSSIGLAFETVTYPGPGGDLSAWYVPGEGERWIIAVHGLGASEREFLRMLDALRDLNLPTLVISYRNDPGAPASAGSLILAGQREWRDVAAAVDYAVAQGADDVVLFGTSMGGALVLSYVMEAEDPPVAGLVLESPAADLRRAISERSGEALPIGGLVGDSLVAVGRLFAWVRAGIDFDTVDYVDRADELRFPLLLFHGTEDDSVPFAVGESLAAASELVEFHPVEDAGHVKAWNEDPEAYRLIVTAFLGSL